MLLFVKLKQILLGPTSTNMYYTQMNSFFCLFQCLFSVRTTLKVCKLGERIVEGSSSSSGGCGYLNEESILDLGRSLYKLHLQLLLLLEAAAKMYLMLSNLATENKVRCFDIIILSEISSPNTITLGNRIRFGCCKVIFVFYFSQLQNLSAEVSTVRRALLRAKEESGTHPLAPTPEESLAQILQESDWPNAMTYTKENKCV